MMVSLGFSPCPNDTFIFYALLHGRIGTGGLDFAVTVRDVEELNGMALRGELDVTKLSCHAAALVLEEYCLLRSGAALGRGCGPLVVSAGPAEMNSLRGKRIAVPGRLTTAFLLLSLYDPQLRAGAVTMPFHMIMEGVRQGVVDAGVVIHEGRFTYQLHGLKEVLDLGRWWEESTGLPVPLGGIAARRGLGEDMAAEIGRLIGESIRYARDNPDEPMDYIRSHAQELSDSVIRRHIDLYVNEFSLDVGREGERAVVTMLERGGDLGLLPPLKRRVFCQSGMPAP